MITIAESCTPPVCFPLDHPWACRKLPLDATPRCRSPGLFSARPGRGSLSGGRRRGGKSGGEGIVGPAARKNGVLWEGWAGRRNPRVFSGGGGGGSLFIGYRGVVPKCHVSVFVAEGA